MSKIITIIPTRSEHTLTFKVDHDLLPYGKSKDSSVWTVVKNYPAGTTLHKMTSKLDGGPIYCQKQFKYFFPVTGNDIYQKSIKNSVNRVA